MQGIRESETEMILCGTTGHILALKCRDVRGERRELQRGEERGEGRGVGKMWVWGNRFTRELNWDVKYEPRDCR